MPFADSRRLTGSNLFFDSAGAVLDIDAPLATAALLEAWQERIGRARAALHWPQANGRARDGVLAVRRHASGTQLALSAPIDQLFCATELNEWALCAALLSIDPARWAHLELALQAAAHAAAEDAAPESDAAPSLIVRFAAHSPVLEETAALARLRALSHLEAQPPLRALTEEAKRRELLVVLDEDALTLGSGAHGRTWPLSALPASGEVCWSSLRAVPAALVTGSNGKTTTVRLLAACARRHGWLAGYNCTDGVFIGAEQVLSGDYSGPAGTRAVLRDARTEAAILETARGGILRRGLAAGRAQVAVVTNVSADHFGEYGIHDLPGLADVKLVVASAVVPWGLLVLNADDALLQARGKMLRAPLGWFALNYDDALLRKHRAAGGASCGVREGQLLASIADSSATCIELELGAVTQMPLTVDGTARYNIANLAGAALAALGLGIDPEAIRSTLASFGASPEDNAGRLMRYVFAGAQVLIDYAHNPEGLCALLEVAQRLRHGGRLGVLLGQAGNRSDADIERLATTVARFRPDFVVIKETETYLRGRAAGEVPAILRTALLAAGMPGTAIELFPSEISGVQAMLNGARSGDVLVLPVHDRAARAQTLALLAAARC